MTRARVALLLLAVPGCHHPDDAPAADGTPGEQGRVHFEWAQGCFFGCPLEQPLLAGAEQTIDVDGPGDDPGVVGTSTDTDVLLVTTERVCHCDRKDGLPGTLDIDRDASCPDRWTKVCDNRLEVRAGVAGTAKLELRDAAAALVDRVTVTVREAASHRFFVTVPSLPGEQEDAAVELAVGDHAGVRVELYDAQGLTLLAPRGVHWTTADEAVVFLSAFTYGAGAEVTAGPSVDAEARAAGATTIALAVPGLEASLGVTVK